jgi:predicted alpha/beta superfamily hydrolase
MLAPFGGGVELCGLYKSGANGVFSVVTLPIPISALLLWLMQSVFSFAAEASSNTAQPTAPPPDRTIRIGERFTLKSTVLNEQRPYWVYLPASYHDKEFAPQRYPVLYLLDGALHFQSVSGVVQFMSENVNANAQIPELIIVAIPNTHRTRDLTPTHSTKGYDGKDTHTLTESGGGPRFLSFLKDELLPHMEQNYRTEPYRILVGHSLGGLFAIGACLENPPVFHAHIAIDPTAWWDDQFLLRSAKQNLANGAALVGSLYIALANDPPNKDFGDPLLWKQTCHGLADFFTGHAAPPFYFRFQYFDAETHASVPLQALYHGLLFTFDNFKPTVSPERGEDPTLMDEPYARVSARLGYKVKPPERFINSSAWNVLSFDRNNSIAMKWLEYNKSLYPKSSNVYASLAEALELRGDIHDVQTAIKLLQRSLEIWPENLEAKEVLQKLRARSKQ